MSKCREVNKSAVHTSLRFLKYILFMNEIPFLVTEH